MKSICVHVLVYLMTPVMLLAQTGSSCGSPYTIPLDGVQRNYATTSNTGSAVFCTISGTSPVTYFQFTTNASGQTPLLDITAPGGTNCEIAVYDGNCTNGNLMPNSSMCFWDATGLWAFAHDYTVLPNHTYNLRIKSSAAGNIVIAGQNFTPSNNTCAGATPIGPTLTTDNNATNVPGTGITPGQICATTIENTGYYTYTVQNTGTTALSIENATCDNMDGVAQVGFQVGFFTGSCSSLWWLSCYAGFGSNVQANTGVLTAGTKVFVIVDGLGGSNCQYSVRAINAEVLASVLKYFSGWKSQHGNSLKWISVRETDNEFFEIQRSSDGVNFNKIGSIKGQLNSNTEKKYQFEDPNAPDVSYYRLKSINTSGQFNYSEIIKVDRRDMAPIGITINNPVITQLNLSVTSRDIKTADMIIRNVHGQPILRDKIDCAKGMSSYTKDLSFLKAGFYTITVQSDEWSNTKSFIKAQ